MSISEQSAALVDNSAAVASAAVDPLTLLLASAVDGPACMVPVPFSLSFSFLELVLRTSRFSLDEVLRTKLFVLVESLLLRADCCGAVDVEAAGADRGGCWIFVLGMGDALGLSPP